jgi:hypothetical protein
MAPELPLINSSLRGGTGGDGTSGAVAIATLAGKRKEDKASKIVRVCPARQMEKRIQWQGSRKKRIPGIPPDGNATCLPTRGQLKQLGQDSPPIGEKAPDSSTRCCLGEGRDQEGGSPPETLQQQHQGRSHDRAGHC